MEILEPEAISILGLSVPIFISTNKSSHYIYSIILFAALIFILIPISNISRYQKTTLAILGFTMFINHILLEFIINWFSEFEYLEYILFGLNIVLIGIISFVCYNKYGYYIVSSIGSGYIIAYTVMLVVQLKSYMLCVSLLCIFSAIFFAVAILTKNFLYSIALAVTVPFVLEIIFNNIFMLIFIEMQCKRCDLTYISLVSRLALLVLVILILVFRLFFANENSEKKDMSEAETNV